MAVLYLVGYVAVAAALCALGQAQAQDSPSPPQVHTVAATPVVTSVASLPGGEYATYRLSAVLSGDAESLYALYATPDAGEEIHLEEYNEEVFGGTPGAMVIPAAFQVAAPFGANVGGVNPAFFTVVPDAAFDSWLTVGLSEGDSGGDLSSIGIDFGSWTESTELVVTDGAVFAMQPDSFEAGRSSDVLVAQLTPFRFNFLS